MFHCYLRGYFNGISELSHTANSLVEITLSDCPLSRTVLDSQNSTAFGQAILAGLFTIFAALGVCSIKICQIIGSDRSETVNAIAATSFRVLQAPLGPIEPSIDWECGDHVNRTTRNGDVVSRIALFQGARYKGRAEPRRRQSRRARRSCIAFGWCESSSPRGSSIVPGLRGGRSSYSQSASEGTRRIGAITLAPALKGHAVTR